MAVRTVEQIRKELSTLTPKQLSADIADLRVLLAQAQAAHDHSTAATLAAAVDEFTLALDVRTVWEAPDGKPVAVSDVAAVREEVLNPPTQELPPASKKSAELAAQKNVDLSLVPYAGDRITVTDVQKYIDARSAQQGNG